VPVVGGLVVGALGASGLSRYLEDLLFGVTPNDQLTLWTVVALLFVVAMSVCFLSARRSTRIEAAVALRE
jgi:hypothetical protein